MSQPSALTCECLTMVAIPREGPDGPTVLRAPRVQDRPGMHRDLSDPVGDGAPMRRDCPGRLSGHDMLIEEDILVAIEVRCAECGDLIGLGAFDGQVLWVENPGAGIFWGTERPGALAPLVAGGV